MEKLFFTWKKMLLLLALSAVIPALAPAQTSDPMQEQMNQLLRRMQEQMRQGMSFDTSFNGGHLQISPDSSSYFYFRVDTSFGGDNGSQFFQFSPFGSPGGQGFPDMNQLFEQFFNGMRPFDSPKNYGNLPPDDGQPGAEGDDELLPEERLRQQETQPAPQEANPPKPAQPAKPAKSTVKTIRI